MCVILAQRVDSETIDHEVYIIYGETKVIASLASRLWTAYVMGFTVLYFTSL